MYSAPALAAKKRNVQSDRYVINQTFDGQSFFKDNNVWVYNQKFADTFGMPPEGVYPELKGIEAAAFRIEDTYYKRCGMGGKAENCKNNYYCVTDICVDETQNPLPWATDQQADWDKRYNSTYWLRPIIRKAYPGVIANPEIAGVVRPFADPETHREANYFQNADMPDDEDSDYNLVDIYGYKRSVIKGLTMITLDYHCLDRNKKKPEVTFRLESRKERYSPMLKRFHEFQLPKMFGDKIESQRQARRTRDIEYYKKLLNFK